MPEVLVSIDLGTTRLKVAAFGTDGTLQHLVVRRHDEHRRHYADYEESTRIWQVAECWWEDTVSAVRELLGVLTDARVLGLSLSGRGGAAVFTDDAGAVIADPWSDTRHFAQATMLRNWRREEGVLLSNYGLGLIAKYLWLRDQHPEATRQIARGFFAKDFLLYRLTGAHMTDWTSGPDGPAWDARLSELDLPHSLLPDVALPWDQGGALSESAASELGIGFGTPVALGAHDGLAANIGAGAIEPGAFAITLGTHAVVRAVAATPPPGAYRFYGMPPQDHIIGGNSIFTGRSVDWFLNLVGGGERGRDHDYQAFEEAARAVHPGADGVRFLPFLAGQVAPEARPDARAMFAGLGLEHETGTLYRAVLEGGAFAVRDVFDQVSGWCGRPGRVRVTGGGAESPLWVDILANVIDTPMEVTGSGVESRGAAMCLAILLGLHDDLASAASHMIRLERVFEPETQAVAAYRKAYDDWSRLNEISKQLDPSMATQ
jgi:xylulokinase